MLPDQVFKLKTSIIITFNKSYFHYAAVQIFGRNEIWHVTRLINNTVYLVKEKFGFSDTTDWKTN